MAEAAPVRWGIMGTGKIASDFVKCLRVLEGAEVVGVGSRSAASAEVFASEHGLSCAQAFGSYEALASSEAVEVVYIATPIDRHVEDSLLCLRADKAVLCEKSMARDAGEAATVVQVARERGLFFMHGVWTACFPAVREARRLVAQGEAGPLGTVRQALVDYNQNDDRSADTLGGAISHIGIYPVAMVSLVCAGARGEPSPEDYRPVAVGAVSDRLPSGVEQQSAAVLRYANGTLGLISAGLTSGSPRQAVIVGTKGIVRVAFPFWCPTSLSVERDPRAVLEEEQGTASSVSADVDSGAEFGPQEFPLPLELAEEVFHNVNSAGLYYEAAEVQRCLRLGLLESPLLPNEQSVAILETMDAIAAQDRDQAAAQRGRL